MEEKKTCPWCGARTPVQEKHSGPNGKMRIIRCADCRKIVSVRLEGEPDSIINSHLLEADK